MTDSKHHGRYSGAERRGTRAETAPKPTTAGSREAYANLLKRSEKPGGRHSAITNSLYSWHSYKNWAEKIRGSFDEKK
ncbi:MAG: hypothetical protein WB440_11985 [Steroidobacteraceae bacterium]|jgi:hypothetical protein